MIEFNEGFSFFSWIWFIDFFFKEIHSTKMFWISNESSYTRLNY